MSNFILAPKGLFLLFIAIVVVVLVQFSVLGSMQTWTKVSEGQCTFKSWEKSGSSVRLNLTCAGKDAYTEDTDITVGYLTKPKPLTCSLYAFSNKAFCELTK